MIIHAPELTRRQGQLQIAARIEFEAAAASPQHLPRQKSQKRRGPPPELWFRFDDSITLTPTTNPDPFVVGLLLVAMQNGEDITVEGSLSRQLFAGLSQYQDVYCTWFPKRFKKVAIIPTSLRDLKAAPSQRAACAFSGGVDSSYTFFKLLSSANKPLSTHSPLSHAIFMAGFDMPLHLTASIAELATSYQAMTKALGIELLCGATNIRAFVDGVDWTNSHGGALAATALLFHEQWTEFFVPSSYTAGSYPKWGTHPALDPLLSTESMRFVHHGDDSDRLTKLATLCHYLETYSRLRVCWIQNIGLRNCGTCEKCIRTMIALEILDCRERYTTFASSALSPRTIRNQPQRTHQARIFARELMREAWQRGKLQIWGNLAASLLRRHIKRLIFQINQYSKILLRIPTKPKTKAKS